jgi:hypothetical protein
MMKSPLTTSLLNTYKKIMLCEVNTIKDKAIPYDL